LSDTYSAVIIARDFAKGYNTKSVNRGKLFMWKLAKLEKEEETRH